MPWDPLPSREWQPTVRSLHMWSQVVGKVRLGLAAPMNHWWHVPLYVSQRGLTTSPIPYGGGLLELEFDLLGDTLGLHVSSGRSRSMPLGSMSVAEFYGQVLELLGAAHIAVPLRPVPVEVANAIPFADDTAPGRYEPDHARALHRALVNAHRVLTQFRGRFLGKASPVHFFWGSFDLATTRFSGRRAPRHPGGVPNCPDYVMHEAYSHEVISAGWWPGTPDVGPAFYTYMYPEPAAYGSTSIEPALGHYHRELGEFVLPYQEAAQTNDPDRTVLDFLEATYRAGANLADWDGHALRHRSLASTEGWGEHPTALVTHAPA